MKPPLIVAGFHRSGTSLVTQLLHTAGLSVGDDLIGAMPSNPYGHFEDRAVVSIHDAILADNGEFWQVDRAFIPAINPSRWQAMQNLVSQRRAKHRLWGFKDPRVCLFMEPWRHLLPEMKVLLVFRHYVDSTHSLERRHSRELTLEIGPVARHRRFWEVPDLALRMWIVHNQNLLRFARAHPDDVLAIAMGSVRSGYPLIDELNARWNLGLTPAHTLSVFDARVTTERPELLRPADPGLLDVAEALMADLRDLEQRTQRTNG